MRSRRARSISNPDSVGYEGDVIVTAQLEGGSITTHSSSYTLAPGQSKNVKVQFPLKVESVVSMTLDEEPY